ncbi:MAG: SDR family oxidoreductase [Pirellulaceae bacterium]|nr:SDR family oxidoreductase [Pirellulaceae bacterium]
MKHVLVTGGSQGLGLVIVERLLSQGWRVTSVQRTTSSPLQCLSDEYPDRLRVFNIDLTDTAAIEPQFRDVWFPENQPVDGLVNNAGMAYDDLVSNLNVDQLDAMMRLNVYAAMALSRAVIRRLLLVGSAGSIVNVSSVCAHTGYKGLAMYAATKGALEAFSRTAAREWGGRRIRCNCVVPGFMETAMSQGLSSDQRQQIYRRNALHSATDPQSVAATVEFLLSDSAASITGQNIVVDAGTI